MKPICSFRQCAISRSFISPSEWPITRMVPEVGRSMAAIRCSSVDLPEPDGPISTTYSPLLIFRVTFFNATTWNSSRTNSLQSLSVSMIVSLMDLCLGPYFVAVLQPGRRTDDHVLAANQPLFNMHALTTRRAGLDRAAHGPPIEHHKDRALAHSRGGHHHHRLGRHAARPRRLLVGDKGHAGVHLRPQMVIGLFHLHLDLHGG